ncbi:MAG: 2-C-methyl-D-erythritol 4-phosphate cytidylyltransferase [Desulfovibrionaceae bacterium]|nr:2-C-methyl-D-erythritol 4-phosphate cytidylyltransferase [Desulfovibrionaceae bacterium]
MKNIWAILLAAGEGKRLKQNPSDRAKQFLTFKGAPLFWHSALTLASTPGLAGLILVFQAEWMDYAAALVFDLTKDAPLGVPYKIVAGGAERQDSVWNALNALPAECEAVLVHDAARPFASAAMASRILEALEAGHQGVIPGLGITDTIKKTNADNLVQDTLSRESLRLIQTPQGFDRRILCQAYAQGRKDGLQVTDDAAMLEYSAFPVLILPGENSNRKITHTEDLALLRRLEKEETPAMLPRTGLGYDVHRYGGNRPLKLGGVRITSTDLAVQAHSDGDVLLHALMDALLGCVGAGDIGGLFPDTDPRYDNMNSAILLAEVLELVQSKNFLPTHVDMTVVAQEPKIAPFRAAIIKNVAHLLHLNENLVNLKATTEEGLGFTGAKQGIKSMVIVSGLSPA